MNIQSETIVKGPTLPMNIVTIITNLPATESVGVIPVDRPTVAKADMTSKIRSLSGIVGVVMQRNVREDITVPIPIEKITKALCKSSFGRVLLKIEVLFSDIYE